MAHWNSEKQEIEYMEPQDSAWEGWEEVDCGCANGQRWGGIEPAQCPTCKGSGILYRHKGSGVIAKYPGGPFLGRRKDN